ncbi:MAG: glutamine amidotransferase [Planctomycetota bacterium]|nr:glutamine amidotransferase [Planctomycetota bacterium]
MTNWSFDILRQGGWDLWLAICVIASLVLLGHAVIGRLWERASGWLALLLIAAGVGGTTAILFVPRFQSPFVGLAWTFILLSILSATFYLNLLAQLGTRRTTILLCLRVFALGMLVPMLFEPVLRFVAKPKPERPLNFLVDASGSMSFPDVQNGPTRLQSVWQTLRPQLDKAKEHFVLRYFTFASDIDEFKKPDELGKRTADGKSTDIVTAVQKVTGLSLRKDAAIVLISDGIDNTSPNVADLLRSSPRPIHTVRVGSEQAEPSSLANVAVDNIETTDDFVVHHESKVKATIKSSALANRVVEVKMTELDVSARPVGQVISKTLVLQPVAEGQMVELPFKPKAVGIQRLAVWIDPIAGERSTVDNRQEFQGLALDPRIKVFYVEGRVRPEFTQLNRALARDPNIEVASLLRIQQERFTASGTVDGEPVTKMPASTEEWKKFDVVILGDMDSSFLSKLQQAGIEQFVFKGGGLIMIGGQNNFGPGGYKDSAIEKALPVFAGELASHQERTAFVPQLTPDGQTHPGMDGLAEWFPLSDPNQKPKTAGQKSLPALRGNVVVPRAKSGASVLLVHAGRPGPDGKPQIVLAVQRYGEGRSAAFTADTTYLWYLPLRGLGQDSPYNRFWGQLIRWLAGEDVRNRQRGAAIDGLLNKSLYQLGESVRVRAMVRDERGDATRYAQVNVKLTRAGQQGVLQVPLNPVESRTGLYDVTIANPDKGDWTAELSATKDGKTVGKQTLKFTVIPPAGEMLKLAANPQLLAAIAEQTKGFQYELAQLPRLIDQLISMDKPSAAEQARSVPLSNTLRAALELMGQRPEWDERYDLPTQGLLVLCLLAAEWIMRRRWQLP